MNFASGIIEQTVDDIIQRWLNSQVCLSKEISDVKEFCKVRQKESKLSKVLWNTNHLIMINLFLIFSQYLGLYYIHS